MRTFHIMGGESIRGRALISRTEYNTERFCIARGRTAEAHLEIIPFYTIEYKNLAIELLCVDRYHDWKKLNTNEEKDDFIIDILLNSMRMDILLFIYENAFSLGKVLGRNQLREEFSNLLRREY